eukprot:CAMPEP_0113846362 /NCGR_PEP_ID=MMETSP0372-20130328/1267_1 /TAXON_ID=340204 /ORGANISM="Lankesteria abbotti" /LENGTH=319 /DNA_ID=CAMNT_0000815501 /DNA_START=38 /DNA_END=997 /DNA_ORIENTATION=+ /assembly_acc=CAM_ASM_000359
MKYDCIRGTDPTESLRKHKQKGRCGKKMAIGKGGSLPPLVVCIEGTGLTRKYRCKVCNRDAETLSAKSRCVAGFNHCLSQSHFKRRMNKHDRCGYYVSRGAVDAKGVTRLGLRTARYSDLFNGASGKVAKTGKVSKTGKVAKTPSENVRKQKLGHTVILPRRTAAESCPTTTRADEDVIVTVANVGSKSEDVIGGTIQSMTVGNVGSKPEDVIVTVANVGSKSENVIGGTIKSMTVDKQHQISSDVSGAGRMFVDPSTVGGVEQTPQHVLRSWSPKSNPANDNLIVMEMDKNNIVRADVFLHNGLETLEALHPTNEAQL